MGEGAELLDALHIATGLDSQLENPSLQISGPHMAVPNQPKLVTILDPVSPEEAMIARVRDAFMQKLQNEYSLRPIGELGRLVSEGYLPTARARFYPEIIIGPVNDWLHSEGVKRAVLDGVEPRIADFERFYQGQRSHESQKWLWEKHVESQRPQSGLWK